MKASDFVAYYLETRGITCAFELVGGMITHLLDSISVVTSIRIVSCHHEQAAGFAAEGFARLKGVPGVALATSGPGATNLLTSVGSCYFDSIPAVFITGQVNTNELKGSSGLRQLGFQETDIVTMAAPICKLAVQVAKAIDLPIALKNAFQVALDGRQGPCLVDIPMNVQSEDIPDEIATTALKEAACWKMSVICDKQQRSVDVCDITTLLRQISTARRPLLLLGGGAASALNREAARSIASYLAIPVVLSLMAVDLIDADNPLRVGFIGSYGNRWANRVLAECDLLVVIGSRLDIRQTGSDVASFCQDKVIWHLDIDTHEIGARVSPQHSICSSIQEIESALRTYIHQPVNLAKRITTLRAMYPCELEYMSDEDEINPIMVLQTLQSLRPQLATCFVTDVGQHQMWAAQCINFRSTDRFLTSGGMGAMGFGLPAAIGASMVDPNSITILVTGDGSFQLNIQELETLRRHSSRLKIILFNNNCHGMVRQFQESYFKGNMQSTVTGYSAPDFERVSKAYGIPAATVDKAKDVRTALSKVFRKPGPFLLQVGISQRSRVYPKLAFGRPFGDMEPEVKPVAMEST